MHKAERQQYPAVGAWPLDDEVIGLRLFGTDQIYNLSSNTRVLIIGSSTKCDIVLRKHSGTVAAQHARLVRRGSRWLIQSADKQTGHLYRDRVALREFPLVPGIEIRIGDVTLVAESERSRAFRRVVTRWLGFGAEQRIDVDRALRTVLLAASGRRALMLCGDGDLAYVARQLHQQTLPNEPFILCDPRRAPNTGTARSPRNIKNPMDALTAAAGGTVCIHAERLPQGFQPMVERWRRSETRVQLVLCSRSVDPVLTTVADSVVLPPLFLRWRERVRIMEEVAAEAAIELGVAAHLLSDADRQVILQSEAATLPQLETATARIVAIRHWGDRRGGLVRAAEALGVTHATLAEWAERRGLITVHHRRALSRRASRVAHSATARPRRA
jgi:hypothetical protein